MDARISRHGLSTHSILPKMVAADAIALERTILIPIVFVRGSAHDVFERISSLGCLNTETMLYRHNGPEIWGLPLVLHPLEVRRLEPNS